MTMVATPVQATGTPEVQEDQKVGIVDLIDAICHETECSKNQARRLVSMLKNARDMIRRTHQPYILSEQDLKVHDLLDEVVPGNVSDPYPGTAHAMINRVLLRDGELNVLHTVQGVNDIVFCAIAIDISRIE